MVNHKVFCVTSHCDKSVFACTTNRHLSNSFNSGQGMTASPRALERIYWKEISELVKTVCSAGYHFPSTSARLSAPSSKTRPGHIRPTSEPHPNHVRTTSELHPNHIRNNGRSYPENLVRLFLRNNLTRQKKNSEVKHNLKRLFLSLF